MLDLIRKRHEGDGWQVFSELANGTGYKVRGWADAAALGIWPSRGYELHGYEFKISREDLKKELRDPQKADNVGRYCHYWWLCLSEAKIMDGLVIPGAWGILVPKGGVLRVVRKAPKVPKPNPQCREDLGPPARTRPPSTYTTSSRESATKKARAELEAERKYVASDAERELRDVKAAIERFEKASGVAIMMRYGTPPHDGTMTMNTWELDRIGPAVKIVREAREAAERGGRFRDRDDDPIALVEHELAMGNRLAAADQLRSLIERLKSEMSDGPPTLPGDVLRDAQAPDASAGDDDERSRVDRRDARTPEQDAGLLLRD